MSGKSRASGNEEFIGVRMQYVPEFTLRAVSEGWVNLDENPDLRAAVDDLISGDPALVKARMDKVADAMDSVAVALKERGDIASARGYDYDTEVIGKEDYDEYLNRQSSRADQGSGGSSSGQLLSERIKGSAARLGVQRGERPRPGSEAAGRGAAGRGAGSDNRGNPLAPPQYHNLPTSEQRAASLIGGGRPGRRGVTDASRSGGGGAPPPRRPLSMATAEALAEHLGYSLPEKKALYERQDSVIENALANRDVFLKLALSRDPDTGVSASREEITAAFDRLHEIAQEHAKALEGGADDARLAALSAEAERLGRLVYRTRSDAGRTLAYGFQSSPGP